MHSIAVFYRQQEVGVLQQVGHSFSFRYHENAKHSISLTMPIRPEPYIYPRLHPIFQMHLPQGMARQLLEHALHKASKFGDLQLLIALNKSQLGALTFAEIGQKPAVAGDDFAMEDCGMLLFNQLLGKYAQNSAQLNNKSRTNASISGKEALPSANYIIKTWGPEYPELAMNESACLEVLKNMGLQVPACTLTDKGKTLIVERFDVAADNEQLNFEDFCVLQGKTPAQRYDSSWEEVAKTVRQFVSPRYRTAALRDLFKLLLCNVVLRNGDAHLKNIGVLYANSSERKLAPFFDINCTTIYLDNDFMALGIDGDKNWPHRKTLQNYAAVHCNLSAKEIDAEFKALASAVGAGRAALYQLGKKRPEFATVGEKMESVWQAAMAELEL